MAIDLTFWEDDLDAMIEDMPALAKWDGVEFNVSLAQLSQETTLVLTGEQDGKAFECVFKVSSVAGLDPIEPNIRLQIKFPDTTTYTNYQVRTVQRSADNLAYHLVMLADHRN